MNGDRFRRFGDALKLALFRIWQLLLNGIKRMGDHRGTQLAASMAYYGLLSVFPIAIVVISIAGIFFNDAEARSEIINFLIEELPLNQTEARNQLGDLIDGVAGNAGSIGLLGAFALVFTSSALMGATRNSVNIAFEDAFRRGVLRGKAVDVALVLGLGSVFVLSFTATLLGELDLTIDGDVGRLIEQIFTASGALLPLALASFVFSVLLHLLPVGRPPLRDIWPGVVFAALGYEVVKRAFSIYLDQFANYNAIYGSLGAVVAFLFFVYLASLVFLLGAEIAALWPRVRAGEFDPGMGEGKPIAEELKGFVIGLVSRGGPPPDEIETTPPKDGPKGGQPG